MKSTKEIQDILKVNREILEKRFKVKEIGIFGSCARDKMTKNSDIDILVSFKEPIGWEFVDLKEYLENVLGCKIDLVTVGALKRQIKDNILREVIYA